MKGCIRVSALVVVAAVLLAVAAPVQAGGGFLFNKKFHGVLLLGTSGYLFKEAYDARQEADDRYELYKVAVSPQLARELYDDSKRKDTKSAVLVGLGAATLAYSIHLFLSDSSDELPPPKLDRGLVKVKGVALDVTGDPMTKRMQVQLKRGF